jgi:acetyltransferase-like isoleucine patch superfamily enzyme
MESIAKTAVIHDGVKIGKDVIIHDYVVIYPNSVLEDNVEIFDHCVIGKEPKAPGCTAREIEKIKEPTIIGKNTILSPFCCVYSGTKIGNNCLLGDYASIREHCEIGEYTIISRNVSVNYNTIIGSHTKIMDNSHITGNMKIGDNVFISVLVATTNDNSMGREGYNENVNGPVIEDNVTIGASASILPNVKVGKNSIVGSGAVVTKDVEENKVVMGIPARVIRDVE